MSLVFVHLMWLSFFDHLIQQNWKFCFDFERVRFFNSIAAVTFITLFVIYGAAD